MKTPSLQEVKDYFKDALEVRTVYGDIHCIEEIVRGYVSNSYMLKHSNATVYEDGAYAKITKRKENEYKITKETIIKYQMKDEFPSLFNPYTGWAKDRGRHDLWMVYFEKGQSMYGFDIKGDWFVRGNDKFPYDNTKDRPSEPKEVESFLVKEAKKRGYINGNYECLSNLKTHTVLNKYHLYNNELFHGNELDRCNIIFSHGTWATILPNKKKMTISEIEDKLGFEIEIV